MLKWLQGLQGKKTYIGAGILAAAAIAGFFLGQLDLDKVAIVLGSAIGMAGLAAKLNRYLPDVVQALEEIKKKDFGKLIITGGKVAAEISEPGVTVVQGEKFEDDHVAGDPPENAGK
jgi:hypothetical protein